MFADSLPFANGILAWHYAIMKYHESTTIDGAGRVVIPKGMRDRLRLRPGTRIRIDGDEERLVIRAESAGGEALEHRDGLLILAGSLDSSAAEPTPSAQSVRADRMRKLSAARP